MEGRGHGPPRVVGRYAMYDAIAAGGMATVHFGRLIGPAGFSRTVVIKRLHAQFAGDDEVATMFLDEAKVAARIRHPNVVAVVDVVAEGDQILLVMEYVHGESLAYLTRADARRSPGRFRLLGNVIAGVLHGLHAAHEATGENGLPLGVVHRDVSPQNILVGVDGVARVLDFGIAKAACQMHTTSPGLVKGKLRYLSPEQVSCDDVDRRSDLWSAAIVLWEACTGKRLFHGDYDAGILRQVLEKPIPSPREVAPDVPEALAQVVMHGLERDRARRFSTAQEMAAALEGAVGLLAPREVGAWVERLSRTRLDARRRVLDEIEAEAALGPKAVRRPPTTTEPDSALSLAAHVSTPPGYLHGEDRPTAPVRPARRRVPGAAAWGAAAAVVIMIAAGVGARALAVRVPATGLPAAATLPQCAQPEAAAVEVAALEAPAPTPPPASAQAPPEPLTSASASRPPPHHPPTRRLRLLREVREPAFGHE